ncbi:MAG: 4Fe-4S dicluster domain-containing protein [Desulfobacteraceae bacterium]|nr:MAG: 4Fe-4S dicluster domain-containing protein [Desulfobacteraceae bacterium]
MAMDRREFLKLTGYAALLGLGGKGAFELFAPGEAEAALKSVPITAGKKWGMVVNMSRLNDEAMEKCIEACHRFHNVPNIGNPKEEIKWIWKEAYEHTFPGMEHEYTAEKYHGRNVLVLCNHCTNPPCVRACPTKATWKRDDGIVMMDMHRCIGCRFCMAACPYGARSFNWGDPRRAPKELNANFPTNPEYPTRTKGVVEKCNFCAERIAAGQQPACVEAANSVAAGVMVFGDLDASGSEIRKVLHEHYSIRRKSELGTGPNIYYIV